MPSIEQFVPQTKSQPWGEEILVARVDGLYTGKVLKRYAGEPYHRAGLQAHPTRDETFFLYSGEAYVYFDPGDGRLRRFHMTPGQSFHVPPGAVHSVQTIGDSVMFEASMPIVEANIRVEDRYRIEDAIDVTAEFTR